MNIAFKEWTLVCDALGSGHQSIIIRKGGIAEGRDGFGFKHEAFFLFPTLFHHQLVRTRHPDAPPLPERAEGEPISINLYARVEWACWLDDRAKLDALAPYHIWRDEVVQERFHWGEPAGVHLAAVRVYRLATPWHFPDSPRYGGCRSWLTLPAEPASLPPMHPVLSEQAHAARMAELAALLGR